MEHGNKVQYFEQDHPCGVQCLYHSVCLCMSVYVCVQQSEKREEENTEFVSAVCWRTVSLVN